MPHIVELSIIYNAQGHEVFRFFGIHSISHTGALIRTVAGPLPRTSTVRNEAKRMRDGSACSVFSPPAGRVGGSAGRRPIKAPKTDLLRGSRGAGEAPSAHGPVEFEAGEESPSSSGSWSAGGGGW